MHYQPPSMTSRWEIRSEQRLMTAFHEGGHTLSYLAHGIVVEQVCLLENDSKQRRGYCQYRNFGLTPAAEVVSALSGQAADRVFSGVGYTSDLTNKDYEHAFRAAIRLAVRYDVEPDRVVRFGRLVALELVGKYARQIEQLVRVLVMRGALDEDEIGDIVGSVEQIHVSPLIGILKDIDEAEEDDTGDDEEDDEADGHEEPSKLKPTRRDSGDGRIYTRHDGVLLSNRRASASMAPGLRFECRRPDGGTVTRWSIDRGGWVR
jgi:hypothetical protein